MKEITRILAVVATALLVMACSGCIRIGIDVAAAPDGSTSARLLAGIDASFAKAEETKKDPFSDLSASGGNWKTRSYQEGNWQMTEAIGSAPPGKPIFPKTDKDAPQVKLIASAHRLSTQYTLTLYVPPTAQEMTKPAAGADEQMQAMMKGMLSTFQMNFSLKGPGRVVATTGKVVGPGKAEWKMGFADLDKKAMPDFRVVTELPNWSNLGHLADQLAYTGRMDDAAPKLAAAVARGLLPNPVLSARATDKLKPEDYANLLEIIDKLDIAGRPAVTADLIGRLKLNADDASSATIAAAYAKVMKLDVSALSGDAVAGAILRELK